MKSSHYNNLTDAQLLEHYYSDNDLQWVGLLLQRYTLLLLGLCMKYLKDEEKAKDSVQQIYLKVLVEVPKYRIEHFKSWLYRVAKNHCLMQLRAKGGKGAKELTEQNAGVQTEENKQELLANEQAYALLGEAVSELNNEQKQCVTLFYLEKNSYSQISEKTGFSPMQVKSYIQNGKRNLRLILERKLKATKAS